MVILCFKEGDLTPPPFVYMFLLKLQNLLIYIFYKFNLLLYLLF